MYICLYNVFLLYRSIHIHMFLPNRCQVCKVMDFWNTSFQNGGRLDVLTAFRGFSSRSRKRGELPGIADSWKGMSRRRRGNSAPQGGRKQRIRCPKHCQQGLTAVSLSNWKMVKELWWLEIPRLFYVVFIQMSWDIHDFPQAYLIISVDLTWVTSGLNAEAQIEAIEEMDQQDQHHRSAQHCMDGSFLGGVTHGHS